MNETLTLAQIAAAAAIGVAAALRKEPVLAGFALVLIALAQG